jgi:hypothetical protein
MAKYIVLAVLLVCAIIVVAVPMITLAADPCKDPRAYCYTDSNGCKWCGYKGQTSVRCSCPPSTKSINLCTGQYAYDHGVCLGNC